MSGADNSTVSIVIRVIDDSGAIKNVETKLSELGTAGTATNAKVAGMGSAAKQAGAEGAAAFASMGAAATEGAAGATGALGRPSQFHGTRRNGWVNCWPTPSLVSKLRTGKLKSRLLPKSVTT
jgi:hypothetical protein